MKVRFQKLISVLDTVLFSLLNKHMNLKNASSKILIYSKLLVSNS